MINKESFGAQEEQIEDVTLGCRKLWLVFFQIRENNWQMNRQCIYIYGKYVAESRSQLAVHLVSAPKLLDYV